MLLGIVGGDEPSGHVNRIESVLAGFAGGGIDALRHLEKGRHAVLMLFKMVGKPGHLRKRRYVGRRQHTLVLEVLEGMAVRMAEYALCECGSVVETQCATARISDLGTKHDMFLILLRLSEIALTQLAVSRIEDMAGSERLLPEPVARTVVVQGNGFAVSPVCLDDTGKGILIEFGGQSSISEFSINL